jgi:hypothetical protein
LRATIYGCIKVRILEPWYKDASTRLSTGLTESTELFRRFTEETVLSALNASKKRILPSDFAMTMIDNGTRFTATGIEASRKKQATGAPSNCLFF